MSSCEQIKQDYQDLKTLKQEFDLEYQKAVETGDLARAKELRAELEQKRDALADKLWPLERLPQKELKEQYASQREILERTGILEQLSSGEMGIKGTDNEEYAFPSYQEITQRMRESEEALRPKTEQGFIRLQITPFGMKLDDLIDKYKQVILKHHKEGKLLATKENPFDPDEQLELDENNPVWLWGNYRNADVNGEMVYYPKEFSSNHQGKTKQEVLKEQGGWNILLAENLPNIPRKNKGEKIKGRKQLEAGKTPYQYLETLKTDLITKTKQE
ncbi:MAG: hypothetical protein A2W55_03015 [Candidatus Nealsonbacteria bacterium RIFCSPHIGHO2_02_38_10]|nr:MAG: hypothetical protein A2W55_03015 [Candidatus Nealsonbacteria bacterium RIFCSPHIGHO2_02_38_10]